MYMGCKIIEKLGLCSTFSNAIKHIPLNNNYLNLIKLPI